MSLKKFMISLRRHNILINFRSLICSKNMCIYKIEGNFFVWWGGKGEMSVRASRSTGKVVA